MIRAAPQRIALAIEFDGAQFNGTQSQAKGERTVQDLLAETLIPFGILGLPRPASRLDQGVSAEWLPVDALLAHLPARQPVERTLGQALAAALPADVTVRAVALVDHDWHAQHDAGDKTYRYTVLLRGTAPALDRRCWWVKQLDRVDLLQSLADQLVGTRDLRQFACLRRDETDLDDGTRTIHEARWTSEPWLGGTRLLFRIRGTGFLYKQIRGLVGAMIHLGMDRRPVDDFTRLVAGDATVKRIGNIAPPEALMLERVAYGAEPAWVQV